MRKVPSPNLFAQAIENKYDSRYHVAVIEDEKHAVDESTVHRSASRTQRHRGVCVERADDADTYTDLFSMAAANGYYAIESEGEYVWLAHPEDSTLQRMQSPHSEMWTEKYSAWEYVDVPRTEQFKTPKQYE